MIRPLPFGEIIPPLYEVATARRRGEVERWGVGEGRPHGKQVGHTPD